MFYYKKFVFIIMLQIYKPYIIFTELMILFQNVLFLFAIIKLDNFSQMSVPRTLLFNRYFKFFFFFCFSILYNSLNYFLVISKLSQLFMLFWWHSNLFVFFWDSSNILEFFYIFINYLFFLLFYCLIYFYYLRLEL